MENKQIKYTDHIIWSRLNKHILERVKDLCKEVKIVDGKLIRRVENMVKYLLKDKPYLLSKNKIDQILICVITSFLTVNQFSEKKTLENVFKQYNNLELSYNTNMQGLQGAGK